MKYKKSKYNIIVDKINDETLLYNTISGAYVLLDSEDKKIYDNIEKIINKLDGKELETFNIMKENRIIVDSQIDELQVFKIMNNNYKYASDTLTLTIAPTMNCNMRCPYCYEKKESSIMTNETLDNLLNFVKNILINKRFKELDVTWYGGEPLLAKDLIYKLSENIIGLCKEKNINYTSSMVTNGTLLDEETAKYLSEKCKVSEVQVTLDGMPEVNDKRRKLINKKGSFNIITRNINLALPYLKVNVRSNVDKENIDEAIKLIEYFNNEKLLYNKNFNLYFAPITAQTDMCNQICNSTCLSSVEFSDIVKTINKKFFDLGLVPNIYEPSYMCKATGMDTYVIDSNGFIYRCWDEVETESLAIGTVKDGIKLSKRFIDWLSLDIPEKCLECNMLPICTSSCPYQRLRFGDNKIECSYKKYVLKQILGLNYEKYQETRNI